MTNEDLLKNWIDWGIVKNNNNRLFYDAKSFINYKTVIAIRKPEEKIIYLNVLKYSSTTSTHQNRIIRWAERLGYKIIEVKNYNEMLKLLF